MMTNTRLAIHV